MTDFAATLLKSLALFASCYVLGAVPFAFIVTRAVRGIDLRKSGSGNLGTANAARAAGILPALVVFAGDFGKGALGMAVAVRLFGHGPLVLGSLAAIVLGHNFSPFVGFSGGKGLAAAAGGLLIFSPWLLIATLTLGLAIVAASGDFYLAAMAMAAALPGLMALFAPGLWRVLLAVIVAVIVLIRHRVNIAGLWPDNGRRARVRDDVFALLISLAALAIVIIQLAGRSGATCVQLPMLIVAGRWTAVGLALLAAWALLSRFAHRFTAFLAGSLVAACLALLISPLHAAMSGGGAFLLPPLMTQIGDGNWPFGQVSVAAVGAHHLFWMAGLSVAALVSRALVVSPGESPR